MPFPETIAMRFTEEDAGYVTVRPVVRQTFRFAELTDMVVSITGKDVARLKQIFCAGTVVYNGYRYWWDGFASDESELAALLAPFPEDDPSRPFEAAAVDSISLEAGGGAQRSLISITRQEASEKRLFRERSPWEILLGAAKESPPRYERYSYAEQADVYRLNLSFEVAHALQKEAIATARRALRKKLASFPPLSSLLFYVPRAHLRPRESS